jgi:hypothetical protein
MAELECVCNCIGCTLGLCTSGVVDGCCKSCCKSHSNDNYIQIKKEPTKVRVSRICGKCGITLGPNVTGECPLCKLEKDTTNNNMSRDDNKFKSKKKVQKKSIQKKSKKSIQKKSIQKKKVQKKM